MSEPRVAASHEAAKKVLADNPAVAIGRNVDSAGPRTHRTPRTTDPSSSQSLAAASEASPPTSR